MEAFRISLFGKFTLCRGSNVVSEQSGQKACELLAYLLLNRAQQNTRERMATVLWEESGPKQAKKYLRQALWQLHSAISNQVGGTAALVMTDGDFIYIHPDAPIQVDVIQLEDAYLHTKGIRGRELNSASAAALDAALALYQGDLLENWYAEWCLLERERLRDIYMLSLDKLMGFCEATAQHEAGLLYGDAILRLDHARERTHRRVMRLRYLAGDRSGALRQYERCRAALARELEVKPSRFTTSLYEDIKNDNLIGVQRHFGDYAAPISDGADSEVTPLLGQLTILHKTLGEIQQQIALDITNLQNAAAQRPSPQHRSARNR